jgi:hypothetical protein
VDDTFDPRLALLHILGLEEGRDHFPVTGLSLCTTTTPIEWMKSTSDACG